MSIELYPAPASATPQAPSWAYTAGTIGAGKFTASGTSLNNSTFITLSNVDGQGGTNWTSFLSGAGAIAALMFLSPTGGAYFRVTAASSVGGNTQFTVNLNSGFQGAWGGIYTIIPLPGIAELQAAAGITPDADGTTTPVTSVTTKAGIVTAIS